jgi:hypothetical protein
MGKWLNKKSKTQSSAKTEETKIISVSTVKKRKLIDDKRSHELQVFFN